MSADDTFAAANILHMSDRIEVLIDKDSEILSQCEDIIFTIKSRTGSVFMPEIVNAFMSASEKESFWFDAASPEIDQIISDRKALPETAVDIDGLLDIARLFSHIIDYRSPFTAVHYRRCERSRFIAGADGGVFRYGMQDDEDSRLSS